MQLQEIQIVYKNPNIHGQPQITSSEQAHKLLRENWDDDISYRESFVVLLLNSQNKVLGIQNLSKGGLSATLVDAKLIFSTALKCLASAIILAHNHPSGNSTPSKTDIALTKKLVKIGELLELRVHDHIILAAGTDNYTSLCDEDMM
jgi:DNA repair protein RadC